MYALTTREAVKAALDIAETARANDQVDRAIASASGTVEGHLHRSFRPELATRSYRWPAPGQGSPWTLRLDADELISLTSLTAAGDEIPDADLLLEPNSGPPFTRIEVDTSSSSIFTSGPTRQRAIAVTGLWGYDDSSRPAGTLAAAVASTTATSVTVTDGSKVGVGDLLQVGLERMWVTGRTWVSTGVTLGADLASSVAARSVSVSSGAGFTAGESILVGAETLLVTDVVGDTLVCRRSWDGSVLGSHSSGATVYGSRALTVERGARGSTVTTHLIGAAVTAHVVPAAVEELVVQEALVVLGLRRSGGASQSGEGATAADVTGPGINRQRKAVWQSHGRKARMRSV